MASATMSSARMRVFGFETISLALVLGCAAAIAAQAWMNPVGQRTMAPRAVLALPDPESSGLGAREAARKAARLREAAAALKVLARHSGPATVPNVAVLGRTFDDLGYSLEQVRDGGSQVPRLFIAALPGDLKQVRQVEKRKALFFQTVLPLVLAENERLLADRRRLWRLHFQRGLGQRFDAVDRLWLTDMADRYGTEPGNIDALLARVDVVPPSLALAQAAEESGWGTSRFAREGNALFGQWTFKESKGLVPEGRDAGATYAVRAFGSLSDAVRAYMFNLNTHRAYDGFRGKRRDMRRAGAPLDGGALAGTLTRYSARGGDYVRSLRTIIEVNKLLTLDDARLVIPDADGQRV